MDRLDMILERRISAEIALAEATCEGTAVPSPSSHAEATRLLSEFRPSRNTPQTLAAILDARADPNIITGDGDIHPLLNVMAFARKAHVRTMRRLLLEAGAEEDDEARKRWVTRCRADEDDKAWMERFHREPDLVALVD